MFYFLLIQGVQCPVFIVSRRFHVSVYTRETTAFGSFDKSSLPPIGQKDHDTCG